MTTVAEKIDAVSTKLGALVGRMDALADFKMDPVKINQARENTNKMLQSLPGRMKSKLDCLADAIPALAARMDAIEHRRRDAAPSDYTGPKDPKEVERVLDQRGKRNDDDLNRRANNIAERACDLAGIDWESNHPKTGVYYDRAVAILKKSPEKTDQELARQIK